MSKSIKWSVTSVWANVCHYLLTRVKTTSAELKSMRASQLTAHWTPITWES